MPAFRSAVVSPAIFLPSMWCKIAGETTALRQTILLPHLQCAKFFRSRVRQLAAFSHEGQAE